MKKTLIKNSGANLVRGFVSFPLTLYVLSYAVRSLGTEIYGAVAIIGAYFLYLTFLQGGFNTSVVKWIAEYTERKETKKINSLISSALLINLLYSILIILVAVLLQNWFVESFNFESVIGSEYLFVYYAYFVITCLLLFSTTFTSIIEGLQRMEISNAILLAGALLEASVMIILLNLNYGVLALVYAAFLKISFVTSANFFVVRNLIPTIALGVREIDRKMVVNVINFSSKIQVVSFYSLAIFQLPKILLGLSLGPVFVSYYDLASKVIESFRTFSAMLFTPIVPAASALSSAGDMRKVKLLMRKTTQYLFLLTAPILILVVYQSEFLVRLWLGDGFDLVALTIRILFVASFVNILTGPAYVVSVGAGKLRPAVYSSLFGLLLLLLLLVLVMKFQVYMQFIYVVAVTLTASSLLFAYLIKKSLASIRAD